MRIFPAQAHCADCYDAGMLAYLYSVHRCAYMGYAHIEAYTAKMIRIYLICAKVAFYEATQLCRENQLYEVRLESLPYTFSPPFSNNVNFIMQHKQNSD